MGRLLEFRGSDPGLSALPLHVQIASFFRFLESPEYHFLDVEPDSLRLPRSGRHKFHNQHSLPDWLELFHGQVRGPQIGSIQHSFHIRCRYPGQHGIEKGILRLHLQYRNRSYLSVSRMNRCNSCRCTRSPPGCCWLNALIRLLQPGGAYLWLLEAILP